LDLLLPGDGPLRTTAAPSVGPGALAANRQPAAVPLAAVRADVDQALDVHRHLAAKVALDEDLLRGRHPVDDLAKAGDFLFREVLDARLRVGVGRLDDLGRGRPADAVDVHQRDLDALLRGYVDTGDSRQLLLSWPCRCLCLGFLEQITRTTPD